MQRSTSFLLTCGLAVFLAVVLWIWQRDDPAAADPSAPTESEPQSRPVAAASAPATRDRSRRDDPSRPPGPKLAFPTPEPAPVLRPEDLPEEVNKARIEAFRGWQDEAHRQLMTCLPPWTENGATRAVRIYFPPDRPTADPSSADEDDPPPLRPDTVEPLDPTVEVPPEVRECLDRLRDMTLQLPREAPETQYGHQEILHVMWG